MTWINKTTDALVSPVSTSQLADFLAVDSSSPLLDTTLLTATEIVINYINGELLSRDFEIYAFDSIDKVCLPKFNVTSVAQVTVNGDVITSDYQLNARPQFVNAVGSEVVIIYTAGYASASDIPQGLINSVLMIAGFLFENRGACTNQSALHESGAANILDLYRMNVGAFL